MSIDRIGYPLPVFVRGYACLNQSEMELANQDIDPARPQNGPNGRDAPAAPVEADTRTQHAAEESAPDQATRILSYAPGAVRTTAADKATTYSITA